MSKTDFSSKTILGWREWVSLPDLKIPAIKAKVDTGAKTSSLHAFDMKTFTRQGKLKVRFNIHPVQKNNDINIPCVADVIDERTVTDSGGHREKRLVIKTSLDIGADKWPIELTLTNRDVMKFRMLIGREAMNKHIIVDPCKSYLTGKLKHQIYFSEKKKPKK